MNTLAHQFDTAEQQKEAATLGMWGFLITEVLFFGGVFMSYSVYRHAYPEAWRQGSHQLSELMGSVNTAVLLTSSLMMALAVHFAGHDARKACRIFLLLTMALGIIFLIVKGFEYHDEFKDHVIPAIDFHLQSVDLTTDPHHIELFMIFYFVMTLIHALHMIIGIGLLIICLIFTRPRKEIDNTLWPVQRFIENIGLYWHFVDVVWLFLFPLLYLVR